MVFCVGMLPGVMDLLVALSLIALQVDKATLGACDRITKQWWRIGVGLIKIAGDTPRIGQNGISVNEQR